MLLNTFIRSCREEARPNFIEGRPKKDSHNQVNHAMNLLEEGKTYRQVEELTGISKSIMIRVKRSEKINTIE